LMPPSCRARAGPSQAASPSRSAEVHPADRRRAPRRHRGRRVLAAVRHRRDHCTPGDTLSATRSDASSARGICQRSRHDPRNQPETVRR
jgi:hypothetical protein